ncbi:MAG: V-type ATP synthase subunit D [Sphingobacteriales bacterium]|nr:MAG: V-type ATP synthase subunit D [Sphingobacteriales bacterium]
MSLQFQYNKISLQQVEKGLKMRLAALPTIRSKESALRNEVKLLRHQLIELQQLYQKELNSYSSFEALWQEWEPGLLSVKKVHTHIFRFAGVAVPQYSHTEFQVASVAFFNRPLWFVQGIALLKNLTEKQIQLQLLQTKTELLEAERKKTTQKLHLYERVQIPEHEEAIRKIKRYLEDEDHLAKAAQKLIKMKKENR